MLHEPPWAVSIMTNLILLLLVEVQWHPLQHSCLENPRDGGAWWAAVHAVAKSWARLSDFTFPFQFHALEKEMATHSSVPAWRIPGTGEPGAVYGVAQSRTRRKRLSSSSARIVLCLFAAVIADSGPRACLPPIISVLLALL